MKRLRYRLFIAISTLLLSVAAIAQAPLSIVEVKPLNFGVITTDINRCAINHAGKLNGGCVGLGGFAEFEVRGEPFSLVTVIYNRGAWVNDIKIIPKSVSSQTYILDSSGFLLLKVRGALRTRAGAQQGNQSLNYAITVSY